MRTSRRQFLKVSAAAALLPMPAIAQGAGPNVVVIGGGFAGASAARALKHENASVRVTLVEPNQTFTACPFSNGVLAELRELKQQQFTYDKVEQDGVTLAKQAATAVDAQAKNVTLANGTALPYDRLIMAPGIEVRFDALPGYDARAADMMPHAWQAGEQTLLLHSAIASMEDGGTGFIVAPANPVRCPPGPYERASRIAHYLKTRKPKSKVIILDAKDTFSKQRLFQNAWKELYPNHLEWVSLSQGGKVNSVKPDEKTLVTDFTNHKATVANVIPPQRAAPIAQKAGVADRTGWCPVDPVTFESKLIPNVHVIGDAAIMGAMPKSAFSANAQAKVCAAAVAALLRGEKPAEPRLINTCYSLVAPDYGITVAGVYKPTDGVLADIQGAGGVSPIDAPRANRALEAQFAEGWFKTLTGEVFG
jgi:NADPH-dependent 2,4-dienoyl-CoA reductase/sulfur reductase-like enzyme